MPTPIGILVVHGIGVQRPDFADDFIAEMTDRLQGLGIMPGTVRWEAAYWADLLDGHERDLWSRLSRDNDLDWMTVRQFFINVFADAIAYQRKPDSSDDTYIDIHARIHEHLAKLRVSLGNQDSPLIVIAHSLGSVIMSNYIWDEQRYQRLGHNAFERMETLSAFVTFGSNIPLFTLALPQVVSIAFPPAQLPADLRAKARWLNFFDADDVLGYPLKPLSQSYNQAVSADLEINVGGLFTSWNPLSHEDYWTDNDFTRPVAQLIQDIAAV